MARIIIGEFMNNYNFKIKQEASENNKKSFGKKLGIVVLALFLALLTVLVINV